MDALTELLQAQPVAIGEVARVDVFSYADALRLCNRADPHDEAQARFSIQHALAARLRPMALREAVTSPQAMARALVVEDPPGQSRRGIPITFRDEPGRIDPHLDALGESTASVLRSGVSAWPPKGG